MKRYDSYKDSGVEWIGEIPVIGELNRDEILSLMKKHQSENDYLSMFNNYGVIPTRKRNVNKDIITEEYI